MAISMRTPQLTACRTSSIRRPVVTRQRVVQVHAETLVDPCHAWQQQQHACTSQPFDKVSCSVH